MNEAESKGVCDDCPFKIELDAAERIIQRQIESDLLTNDDARIGRILIGRRRIVLDETSTTQDCPGPQPDKEKVRFCPMPIARISYLANTNDDGNLLSAIQTATSNRKAGFGAEVQPRH